MDPDTCFSMILDCVAADEWAEAARYAEDLREWMMKGGFPPGGGKLRQDVDLCLVALANVAASMSKISRLTSRRTGLSRLRQWAHGLLHANREPKQLRKGWSASQMLLAHRKV